MHIFENLKTSRRLQAEVLLAGFALWQVKREWDKRHGRRAEPFDSMRVTPPVALLVGEETIYVRGAEMDESGDPTIIEVGSVGPKYMTGVYGKLKEKGFRSIKPSEKNKDKLRNLKVKLQDAAKTYKPGLHR